MILSLYYLKQLINTFLTFTLVIALLIDLVQSFRFLWIITQGFPLYLFISTTLLLIPENLPYVMLTLSFIVPLIVYLRAQKDNEITIMQSMGKSYASIIRPIMIFGLFVILLQTVIIMYGKPWAYQQRFYLEQVTMSHYRNFTILLKPKIFFSFQGFTFFVKSITKNQTIQHIYTYQHIKGKASFMIAQKGFIVSENNKSTLYLKNGYQYLWNQAFNTKKMLNPAKIIFQTYAINMTSPLQSIGSYDPVRSQYIFTLLKNYKTALPKDVHKYIREMIFRFSWPILIWIIIMIGGATSIFAPFSRGTYTKFILISSAEACFAIITYLTGWTNYPDFSWSIPLLIIGPSSMFLIFIVQWIYFSKKII